MIKNKFIEIRRVGPIVPKRGDLYHRYQAAFAVTSYFSLPKTFWNQVHEFETYEHSDSNIQELITLLERSNNKTIWQFNAPVGGNEYIRHCAILGVRTLQPVTLFEKVIVYPLSKALCTFLNVFVAIHNRLVYYTSMDALEAQKVLIAGGVITTLDYGARQYLFKQIDGKLHYKMPFFDHKKDWEPFSEEQVPVYFAPYKKYALRLPGAHNVQYF